MRALKLVVFGGEGMLGRAVATLPSEVDPTTQPDTLPPERSTFGHADAEITDLDALRKAAGNRPFDVLINLAAFTRVDDCEREPDRAYAVNCVGARNAAVLAAEQGAEILHVSTDYVFDGRGTRPYREDDPTGPLSAYGRTKLAGEVAVREANPRHYIVRTSWLYGAGGPNFVDGILRKAEAGEALRVVDDQRGSPTYTEDLAPALVRIAASGRHGTWHVTNRGECTWYELAREILARAGLAAPLERTTSEALARPAKRPAYSVLSNRKYDTAIGPPLPEWRDALERYLRSARGALR